MSIPPPGYEANQALPPPPPPAPQGTPVSHEDATARRADDNVQYELKSVQVLRGRESRAKAKWHNQGWEFVSENRGTLRTELSFRRAKPKTLVDHVVSMAAAFRRLQPKTQSVLVASCALIVAGIIGFVVGAQSGGEAPTPSSVRTAASTAPPDSAQVDRPARTRRDPAATAQPARKTHGTAAPDTPVTATTNAATTTHPTSTRPGGIGHVYANCTAASNAGATPIMRGTPDYNANPQLDRDGDGIACEPY